MKIAIRAAIGLLAMSLCVPIAAAEPDGKKIVAPAGNVPASAITFDDGTGKAKTAGVTNPLPTTDALGPSGVTPVTGSATSQADLGPFTPVLGRPVIVTVTGTGSMQLLRSTDGGATKRVITVGGTEWAKWPSPVNEAAHVETEAGVTLYLRLVPSSGTMTGRIAQ